MHGPVCNIDREDLWVELGDIRGFWSNSLCFGGDFNVVRFLGEGRNCSRTSSTMICFSKIIDSTEGFTSHKGLIYLVWWLE